MLSIGAVFAIFAGVNFWFPVFTGLFLNDRIAKAQFLVMFLGVNLTFFPQHFLGLQGMPRRYTDYPDSMVMWNIIRRSGRLIRVGGVMYFTFVIWEALVCARTTDVESNTADLSPRVPTA